MDRFNIVFRGEFLLGHDIDKAEHKLAGLFKLSPQKRDALFAGQTVTIRKDINAAEGQEMVAAAARCGVVLELEATSTAPAAPSESEPVPPAADTKGRDGLCPHCGTRQERAASCPHCGDFFLERETLSRPARIESVSVEVASSRGAKASRSSIFKTIRIAVLLFILLIVGLNTFLSGLRANSWESTLWVGIYPINADGSEAVGQYIGMLDEDTFLSVADFLATEAQRYALPLADPARLLLAPEVKTLPPAPPEGANPLAVIWWSLKMRWYVYRSDTFREGPSPEIKIFVLYHAPGGHERLENSLGIRKGMFGVVHAYANFGYQPRNHVVIAHEILHTLGASDKYDPATRLPVFPDGFADPEQSPLYPQQRAEIMGSRIPQSENDALMPPSLGFTVIGEKTAREINWIEQ